MSRIVFWDAAPARGRDRASDPDRAHVARLAEALGASIVGPGTDHGMRDATHVVFHPDAEALPAAHARFPDARIVLWVHDAIEPRTPGAQGLAHWNLLLKVRGVRLVCATDALLRGARATLTGLGIDGYVRAHRIYDAVPDGLVPDGSRIDRDKLVYSGTDPRDRAFAIDAFRALRRAMPSLRLVAAASGASMPRVAGVDWVASPTTARMQSEIRGALCTLCPGLARPQAFAHAMAQSQALGTPALALDLDASREIASDVRQLVPAPRALRLYDRFVGVVPAPLRAALAARAGLFDHLIERVRAWRDGERPLAAPDDRFRMAPVAAAWQGVLAS